MKHKLFAAISTIILALVVVSFANAYAATSVDGVWSLIDTNGATGQAWATGDGDNPTATTSTVSTRVSTQNQVLLDENQVRYGSNTTFRNKSGFGFDGNDNVGVVSPYTPFYLGEFTHYNKPISASNTLDYVYLDVTLSGIQCLGGETPTEGSTLDFSYRFELEETTNSGTCAYPSNTPCADRVTITNAPLATSFTCPEGTYTVQVLGFAASPNNQNNGCVGSTFPGSTSGHFITQENTDNYACLWAQITDWMPTAVDLADFSATEQINAILLNWSSASELSIAGYNLYRSTNPEDVGTQINADMIPAKNPGLFEGAFYELLDETALFGQTYFYTLQVVYADNTTQWSDQVTAITAGYKIFTPFIKRP